MFTTLRLLRAAIGFIFVIQVFGLLPACSWISSPEQITGGMWFMVVAKVVLATIFGLGFFGLRHAINKLHTKRHGEPHPSLKSGKWAL
jgi:hypothetical protein